MTAANTPWERMPVSEGTFAYLRDTYQVWSRLMDGEHIFTVILNGTEPGSGDGVYFSIGSALRAKGLM